MRKAIAVLVVVAVALGVFYLVSKREGDIVLEYKFKPEQLDKYRTTVKMKMNMPMMMGPSGSSSMDTETTMLMTQKVLSVKPDGSAKIETALTDMKPKGSASSSSWMPPMSDQKYTVTMSKTGKVLDDTDIKKMASSMGMPGMDFSSMNQMGLGGVLPDRGINVGQTWTDRIPFLMGGGDIEITATLAADNATVGKRKVCKIEHEYKGQVDIAEMMKSMSVPGMPSMSGEMDITGTGVVFFSREEGKMIKSDDKVKVAVKMIMGQTPASKGATPGGSVTLEMTMDMDSTTRLID